MVFCSKEIFFLVKKKNVMHASSTIQVWDVRFQTIEKDAQHDEHGQNCSFLCYIQLEQMHQWAMHG